MYHLEFTRIDCDNNNQYETLCITVDSYMVKGRMHPRKEGRSPAYCAESIVIFKDDGYRKKGTSYFLKQEYSADQHIYERCLIKDERNNIIVCHSGFMGEGYSSMVDLLERAEKECGLDKLTEEQKKQRDIDFDIQKKEAVKVINQLVKEEAQRRKSGDKVETSGLAHEGTELNIDMNARMEEIYNERRATYLKMTNQESNNENE